MLLVALFSQVSFSQVSIVGSIEMTVCTEGTFEIGIANEGLAQACNVILSADIPPWFDYIGDDQGGSLSDNTVTWNIPQLDAGAIWTARLIIRATAASAGRSLLENSLALTVTYDDCPSDGVNDFAEGPVYSSGVAVGFAELDRYLEDKFDHHRAVGSEIVVMTLTATVTGTVQNARLIEYFPVGWTVGQTVGGLVDTINGTITWDLGTFSGSVVRTYTIKAPKQTDPPTQYYFHSELRYGDTCSLQASDWMVEVRDITKDFPDCDWRCTANDITVERAWHGDSVTGAEFPGPSGPGSIPYSVGDPISSALWIRALNNTATFRYAVWLNADLYVNDQFIGTISQCVAELVPPKGSSDIPVYPFTWIYGDKVELKAVMVSFSAKSIATCADPPDCTQRASKCWSASAIPLETPLIVKFESDSPQCYYPTDIRFTDKSFGGSQPLTYDWNFGDGSARSDVQNPIHTYSGPGTYTATLTLTDANGFWDIYTDTVTLYAVPVVDFISTQPDYCPPLTVEFTDASVPGSPDVAAITSWIWDFGDGETSTLQNPSHNYASSGTYTVTLIVTDSNGCSAAYSDRVTVTLACADLLIEKSAPASGTAGESLTYTLTVTNSGPSDAQNVLITETYDSSFSFSSATPLSDTGTNNQWTFATIAAGASETITITGTVSASATGSLSNTVSLTSTTPDPDTSNNTATEDTLVNASADLLLEKSAPVSGTAGESLTYTLTVTNSGPSDAQGVSVTDPIPTGTEYVTDTSAGTYDPVTGIWSIGTLNSGSSTAIDITVKILSDTTASVINSAAVTATTSDPDPANNTATVTTSLERSADLSVTKSSSPDPVIAGESLTYTITITNDGPSDASNVVLTDTLPTELINPEYSLDGGITWSSWTGSVSLGTITDTTSEEIVLRGTVDSSFSGTLNNSASVASDTPDPDTANNSAIGETKVLVLAQPAIGVEKFLVPSSGYPGDTFTFSVVVKNTGEILVDPVSISDTLPVALGLPFGATPSASRIVGQTIIWDNVGPLDPGDSVTLTYKAEAQRGYTGVYQNTASAITTTPEGEIVISEGTVPVSILKDSPALITKKEIVRITSESIRFSITVQNVSSYTAYDVDISDNLPSAFHYLPGSTHFSWSGGTYTEDPQISQGGGRLFWDSSITLEGGEPVGESLVLSFDVIVTDEAEPEVTYTNVAYATGENEWGEPIEPDTDEPDDTDPDDYDEVQFTIVVPPLPKLDLKKSQAITPALPCEVAGAELEKVWFQTDISMYASTEFLFTGKDFLDWAERNDLTINPISLRPTGISILSAQSHKYSLDNIRSLVFNSGMGLNLLYGPRIERIAGEEGMSNETALQRLLEKYAQASGLEKLPENPQLIFAPYEAGDPRYIQEVNPEDWSTRKWQDYDFDLVPSALGQSLAREVLLVKELLASNHTQEGREYLGKDALSGYLGLVVMEETANHLLFLEKLLALTEEEGYFPHRIKVKLDLEGRPIDYTITDSSSHLFDQISLLWGLVELKLLSDPNIEDNYDRLFGQNKMFSLDLHELSSELAEKLFDNIHQMHYHEDRGILADMVAAPGFQVSQPKSISTTQVGLSLLVLERTYQSSYDNLALQERIKELALRQAESLLNNLRAPEGGFYDEYNLEDNKVISEKEESLASHAAAIRGLLATYKFTGDERLVEAAREGFDYLEKRFWNEDFRIYASSVTDSTAGYSYTPLNVGLTVGALRELIYLSDKLEALHILSRLADFFHNILEEAALELSWANLEGKIPIIRDSGRNQIREVGVIEAPFGVASVLQSEIYLVLPPRLSLISLYERGPCEESQAILEEPWFVTDLAMYCATELAKYRGEELSQKMREYSNLNLTTLTLSSGMGLPLEYGPALLKKAETEEVSPEQELEKNLEEFARLTNLKDRPKDLSYIFAEYTSGDPHIEEPKALRWDPDTFDKTLKMSALGMSLVKQVLSARDLLSTNHTLENQEDPIGPYLGSTNLKGYLGFVLTAEMVNKIEFLNNLLKISQSGLHLPHLVEIVFDDKGRPMDYLMVDESSDLFDQLSLLWGLSEFRGLSDPRTQDNYNNLFGEGKPFSSESYGLATSLAVLTYENLLSTHYIEELGTLMERTGKDETRRVSTVNAGLALLALKSFYDNFGDQPELQEKAKKLMISQATFIMERLRDENGGFYSSYEQYGVQTAPHMGSKTLASQLAAIRGLLLSYRLIGDADYLEEARQTFGYLQANFWSEEIGVYRTRIDEKSGQISHYYTPLDLGLAVGALGDLAALSSPLEAGRIYSYLATFVRKVFDEAGLQLHERRSIRRLTPYPSIEEEYFAPVIASRVSLGIRVMEFRERFAKPEDVIIYTITLKNTGEGSAYNVLVEDILPLGLVYVTSEPEAEVKGRVLTWRLGELSPESGPLRIKVMVRVPSGITTGSLLANCATISYTDGQGKLQKTKQACVEAEAKER